MRARTSTAQSQVDQLQAEYRQRFDHWMEQVGKLNDLQDGIDPQSTAAAVRHAETAYRNTRDRLADYLIEPASSEV